MCHDLEKNGLNETGKRNLIDIDCGANMSWEIGDVFINHSFVLVKLKKKRQAYLCLSNI